MQTKSTRNLNSRPSNLRSVISVVSVVSLVPRDHPKPRRKLCTNSRPRDFVPRSRGTVSPGPPFTFWFLEVRGRLQGAKQTSESGRILRQLASTRRQALAPNVGRLQLAKHLGVVTEDVVRDLVDLLAALVDEGHHAVAQIDLRRGGSTEHGSAESVERSGDLAALCDPGEIEAGQPREPVLERLGDGGEVEQGLDEGGDRRVGRGPASAAAKASSAGSVTPSSRTTSHPAPSSNSTTEPRS